MAVPWAQWSPVHGRFIRKRSDVAVVCFCNGVYTTQISALTNGFSRHSPEISLFIFTEFKEIDSPTHQENPYAFKYYAIEKVRKMGYRIVIWCDSVLKLQKSIAPLIDEISKVGVYLQEDGWNSGQWANDRCLEYFGITRDEAEKIQSIWACFMGFDFSNPVTHEFMRRYKEALDNGIFRGKHWNTDKTESSDPRCRGHRHDQVCAEIIAHQMKLPLSKQCVTIGTKTDRYFLGRSS
jgi:hypothetical protein